jgi:hypothetical protein
MLPIGGISGKIPSSVFHLVSDDAAAIEPRSAQWSLWRNMHNGCGRDGRQLLFSAYRGLSDVHSIFIPVDGS